MSAWRNRFTHAVLVSLPLFLPVLVHARTQDALETESTGTAVGAAQPAPNVRWEKTLLVAKVFLGPLPDAMPGSDTDTTALVSLGRKLYDERGMSVNKTQSCSDCHPLANGRAGVDNQPTSKGAVGKLGKRNSPTVLNAGFQVAQFWDGRAADLTEQAKGPILNPVEMGMRGPEEVVAYLKSREEFRRDFAAAYPNSADPVTYDNVSIAIAAYERTLVTPGRFDLLMKGHEEALTVAEKDGLGLFVEKGCIECHSGRIVGGELYRKLGQYHSYSNTSDVGRYDVTKLEEDRYVFKVPMLRNVTMTAPYFHDGLVATLAEAVKLMGHLQLGIELESQQIQSIIQFLGSLEATNLPSLDGTNSQKAH